MKTLEKGALAVALFTAIALSAAVIIAGSMGGAGAQEWRHGGGFDHGGGYMHRGDEWRGHGGYYGGRGYGRYDGGGYRRWRHNGRDYWIPFAMLGSAAAGAIIWDQYESAPYGYYDDGTGNYYRRGGNATVINNYAR